MNWDEYFALRDAMCAVDGCERPTARIGATYCRAHERRVKRTGSPGSAEVRKYTKRGGGTQATGQ